MHPNQAHPPLYPSLEYEAAVWKDGYYPVVGLDEAGRGALAGPVMAAAVILPQDPEILQRLNGVRDSKLMTAPQRTAWAAVIKEQCICWSTGLATHHEIDASGIAAATRQAMLRALKALPIQPEYLLIDYLKLPEVDIPQQAITKGDRISLSIAAASVIAKTWRDALMVCYHDQFPLYQFARHKGYGTCLHRQALANLGACEIHRKTFQLKQHTTEVK